MKRTTTWWTSWLLAAALLLAGCSQAGSATPAGNVTPGANATTGAVADDDRGATALQAYPPALAKAKEWQPDAVLYQIVMTRLMEQNLGLSSGLPGWFFMFRVPGSPVEYYVKIVGGTVNGVTEAQPVIIGEPPYIYLPLDLESLPVTSEGAWQSFLANGGAAYVANNPEMVIDYRLVHIEGQTNPVWSIFDARDLSAAPLYNVDAVTGATANDPYQP